MRISKLMISIIFMMLSILAIYFSNQLPASRGGAPGSGAWPILISIIMFCSSLLLVVTSFREQQDYSLNLFETDQKRVYLAMFFLVIYFMAMNYIGFAVSTFIMLFGFIGVFSSYNKYYRLGLSFFITFFVYSLFKFILKTPLNFGILF